MADTTATETTRRFRISHLSPFSDTVVLRWGDRHARTFPTKQECARRHFGHRGGTVGGKPKHRPSTQPAVITQSTRLDRRRTHPGRTRHPSLPAPAATPATDTPRKTPPRS